MSEQTSSTDMNRGLVWTILTTSQRTGTLEISYIEWKGKLKQGLMGKGKAWSCHMIGIGSFNMIPSNPF